LLRTPGVLWHSILAGPQSGSAKGIPPDIAIRYHGVELTDFGESAALREQLVLLISVDTAAAHLGGALAKPVWLLVPFNPDWRWLIDREDSPWYPTMRLFRQPRPGAWGPVVASARSALTVFVEQYAEGCGKA
jgi:ADP-heptose:LPS heptosyltransferase